LAGQGWPDDRSAVFGDVNSVIPPDGPAGNDPLKVTMGAEQSVDVDDCDVALMTGPCLSQQRVEPADPAQAVFAP
jgi:hypothetical protein